MKPVEYHAVTDITESASLTEEQKEVYIARQISYLLQGFANLYRYMLRKSGRSISAVPVLIVDRMRGFIKLKVTFNEEAVPLLFTRDGQQINLNELEVDPNIDFNEDPVLNSLIQ